MEIIKEISDWIKHKVEEAKAEGIVVGLSGGLDSSVVACLAEKSLGNSKVLGLIMPCHNNSLDEEHAYLIARKLNIKVERVALNTVYDKFLEILPSGKDMAIANIKPRLRMITLYYFANNLNYLVLGTGNKSEILIGYFTKYGDGGCDILPLGGLLKSEVRELAKELKIPEEIIKKPPSAGLWEGQTDEGEIGLSYRDLDRLLLAIESGEFEKVNFLSKETVDKVRRLVESSKHKRASAPIFKR